MFCPNCGSQIEDGSAFCPQCGARIDPVPAQPAPQQPAAQPAMPQSAQQPQQPAWNGGPAAQQQAWGAQQQPGAASGQWQLPPQGQPTWNGGAQQPPFNGAPAQPAGPVYPKGCLAQAFDDILHIKDAMTRILQIAVLPTACGVVAAVLGVLTVLSIAIPLLPDIFGIMAALAVIAVFVTSNCANGYAIEWGRELSRGRGFDMKGKVVRQSLFSLGFFGSAVNSVLQLVAWVPFIIVALLAFFNLIGVAGAGAAAAFGSYYYGYGSSMNAITGSIGGAIALLIIFGLVSIALSIFAQMFGCAAVMHLGVTGRVESAFDLKKIWTAVKPQMGKLFCAAVLPGWIVAAASFAVRVVLSLLTLPFVGLGYSYPEWAIISGFGVTIITMVLGLFLATFGIVLTQRAMGHWAARYASEWTREGDKDFDPAA